MALQVNSIELKVKNAIYTNIQEKKMRGLLTVSFKEANKTLIFENKRAV